MTARPADHAAPSGRAGTPDPRVAPMPRPRATLAVAAALLAAAPPAARAQSRPVSAPAAVPATAGAPGTRPNTLTAAERAAGWRLLFDGTSLRGWRGLGRDTVPTAHWTVEDGAIKKIASGQVPVQADGQPVGGGDLMTEATFGDFELTWEWRLSPGGNSGVKYNVSERLSTSVAPPNAAKGFEYQMIDDDRHPDGRLATHRTADLYDLVAADGRKRVRPAGGWNRSRLVFRGTHGEHWLNGAKVVEYDLGTPRMRAALAASKYRGWAWFGERRRGHLVLQDHNDAVWFRDLKLRELGAGPGAR